MINTYPNKSTSKNAPLSNFFWFMVVNLSSSFKLSLITDHLKFLNCKLQIKNCNYPIHLQLTVAFLLSYGICLGFLTVFQTDSELCLQMVRKVNTFHESLNLQSFNLCYPTLKLTTSTDFIFQVNISYFSYQWISAALKFILHILTN